MSEHQRHRLSVAAAILIVLFIVFLLAAIGFLALMSYEMFFTPEGWP